MSEIALAVGQEIRRIRRQRGMALEKMAELADLSLTYCGEIERGRKDPSLKTLAKLARALDVPLRDLIAPLENTHPVTREELLQRIAAVLQETYSEPEAAAILRYIATLGHTQQHRA